MFTIWGSLVMILVSATLVLAVEASGTRTFYNCRSIVSGLGITYSSGTYGYARAVIDKVGQVGYLKAS